jgi:hypothetical protein
MHAVEPEPSAGLEPGPVPYRGGPQLIEIRYFQPLRADGELRRSAHFAAFPQGRVPLVFLHRFHRHQGGPLVERVAAGGWRVGSGRMRFSHAIPSR